MRPTAFLRRRRQTGPPTSPGAHRADSDAAPPTATVRVALLGDLTRLGSGLEFSSHGRLTCTSPPADAAIVLTAPCGKDTLRRTRTRLMTPRIGMRPTAFLRRRRQTGPPTSPGAHRADSDVAPPTATVRVALLGDLTRLGSGLEFSSHGRLTCTSLPADAAIVLTPPCGKDTLRRLLQELRPGTALVVVDPKHASTSQQIAGYLDDGATTVVLGTSSRVLAAHLEAVVRRWCIGPAGPPVPP